jgi:hypothetical protein
MAAADQKRFFTFTPKAISRHKHTARSSALPHDRHNTPVAYAMRCKRSPFLSVETLELDNSLAEFSRKVRELDMDLCGDSVRKYTSAVKQHL